MKNLLAVIALLGSAAYAANVTDIQVKALDGFGGDTSSVLTRCQTKVGSPYDEETVSRDVNSLKASKEFQDISVEARTIYSQESEEASDTARAGRPEYLAVRVADTGEGVSAEELPLLTEKYHRGSNTSERDGAGLGLYLTDYFINRMDGYIKLASDNGFSVTFYLRVIS